MDNMCLSINTEDGLKQIGSGIRGDTAIALKLALLQKQANQNFAPNDEIWITESEDFKVPVAGKYEALIIDGGQGGYLNRTQAYVSGGESGNYGIHFVYLEKDQIVPVTIGAGGVGLDSSLNNTSDINSSSRNGGISSFGDVVNTLFTKFTQKDTIKLNNSSYVNSVSVRGEGFGGANISDVNAEYCFFGAGGSASYLKDSPDTCTVGNGRHGAIHLRFFNPAKVQLPTIDGEVLIPYSELLKKINKLEKAFAESCVYNEEEVILESVTWTAPVDAWYEITLFNGGDGGSSRPQDAFGGNSGNIARKLRYYSKGTVINVTIGAGGIGTKPDSPADSNIGRWGGVTTFGDITGNSDPGNYFRGVRIADSSANNSSISLGARCCGAGFGGGDAWASNGLDADLDAIGHFGGGGGAITEAHKDWKLAGNGAQGCVILRWFDPDKPLSLVI